MIAYFLFLITLIIVWLMYELRLPGIIASYLSKRYPSYKNYSPEDKQKIVDTIRKSSRYIQHAPGDVSSRIKTIQTLGSLSKEQQDIVGEAYKKVARKYFLYFLLIESAIGLLFLPFMF